MASTRKSDRARNGADTADATMSPAAGWGSYAAWLLLLGGMGVVWGLMPHRIEGDGKIRYQALLGLMDTGAIRNIKCSYLQPVLSIPLYGVGMLDGGRTSSEMPDRRGTHWWVARFNPLVATLAVAAMYLLLRRHAPRDELMRFLVLLTAASMLPHPLKGYYGEVLSAMAAMVGLTCLAVRRFVLGWLLVVLAIVNTPACGIGMLTAAVYLAFVERRPWHVLPVAIAAGCIVLERYLQTGRWFVTGYEQDFANRTFMPYSGLTGFSYPLFLGLLSLLFSFGKGLLFFTPGLFLPRMRSVAATPAAAPRTGDVMSRCYLLWMVFTAGMLVVYAKWWAWYGGWCWGPRFFLFACVPASYVLATRLSRSPATVGGGVLTCAATVLSAWVAACGAVFDSRTLEVAQGGRVPESAVWYTPEFSVLWRPFVAPTPVSAAEAWTLGYFALAGLVLIGPHAAQTFSTAVQRGRAAWSAHASRAT